MHAGELEYFGKRFHVAAPDFLGVGKSDRLKPWPKDWWWRAARDAGALVEHMGEGPAVVIGTSGGGVAALRLAFERPDLVRAVVADSCVAVWRPGDVQALLAGRGRLSLGQMAFWQKAHGDDWQSVVEADTEMIGGFLETGIDFYEGRLGEIRCPVLLTDSLADEMLPRVAEQVPEMARQIPDCRVFLAEAGRHPLMWSGAEEFRRAADAFLGEIE